MKDIKDINTLTSMLSDIDKTKDVAIGNLDSFLKDPKIVIDPKYRVEAEKTISLAKSVMSDFKNATDVNDFNGILEKLKNHKQ